MTRHTLTAELIGGPTVIIEVGGLRIITDPTFDAPRRYPDPFVPDVPQPPRPLAKTTGPVRSADDVGRVDVALISHDHHEDNLDRGGRALLARVDHVLTTDLGAERLGDGAVGLDDYTAHTVDLPAGGTMTVTGVPAHHGPEGVWQAVGPVTGFVLSGDVPTTYISGDNSSLAVVDEVAARFPEVDIAIVFAGSPGWPELADGAPLTMTGSMCVELSDRWPDATVVPVHCDSWDHVRESVDDVRAAFSLAGKSSRLQALTPGVSESVRVTGARGDSEESTEERNKALVAAFYDAVTRSDFEAVERMCHEDFVFYGQIDTPQPGAQGFINAEKRHLEVFADLTMTVEKMVADGDSVAAYVVVEGDQIGEYYGVVPRGKHLRMSMCNLLTIRDGKVIEKRAHYDRMDHVRQLS